MRTPPLLFALVLLAAPVALADPGMHGVPDFTCQPRAGWALHDYGPAHAPGAADHATVPAPGVDEDGALVVGEAYAAFEERYVGGAYGDFNVRDCGSDPTGDHLKERRCGPLRQVSPDVEGETCARSSPLDFDGDMEYGVGRALLASASGDGATWGSLACYAIEGHHDGGLVLVGDRTLLDVLFTVVSDRSRAPLPLAPGEPDCGDGVYEPCDAPLPPSGAHAAYDVTREAHALLNEGDACNPLDRAQLCLNRCSLAQPPGADGAYHVILHHAPLSFAAATVGHVWAS